MKRREVLRDGAALGAALALPAGWARAQSGPVADALAPDPAAFSQAVNDFLRGAQAVEEGLRLELPVVADNPSAVPVKVLLAQPPADGRHCEEMILLAELNPSPLVCRWRFTPALGTAEVAVRVRLSQSQTLHALARMSDGRVLQARQDVPVSGSGCGM